jgi:hypothetical protein
LLGDGHCADMTIQWLEAEYGQGVARFSATIPVDQIVAFARASYLPAGLHEGRAARAFERSLLTEKSIAPSE